MADWLAKPNVLALGVPSSVMPDGINDLLYPVRSYASIRVVDDKLLVIAPPVVEVSQAKQQLKLGIQLTGPRWRRSAVAGHLTFIKE